jgi:hypothetical protein
MDKLRRQAPRLGDVGLRNLIDLEDYKLSIEFWIQILVYTVSIGTFAGSILTKIAYLDKKMEKHNQLIERMACVERDIAAAHRRMDEHHADAKSHKG